ncbi:metallophosphatase family protein [Paraburkholderia sp. MMS20-SJTN17]|uniref:Metallophosphatase family protein n=1 Tax=Paraburkholderia translucens TaxID=2886945 RepID=A0ABS8KN51_9BURK|nr:metallophosphoesterase family protein [Paraburkholderia sp. MMS20-SJTN17]MCC8405807.1 metallophosphatase family protein [Paraburkholderia sp. MMS20-SJTN17]
MKIAALSDIHGNLSALDAVLADIRSVGADLIVNLGDILSGPLFPNETADRLMPLDIPTIRGNHERQILTGHREHVGASDRWALDRLRPDQLAWIEGLPSTLLLWEDVLLVHGTPGDDLAYFLETVTPSGCREATSEEIECRAANAASKLILCGHTHLQRSVKLADGRFVVNPGSVGLQAYEDQRPFPHRMEMGSPHARYALLTRSRSEWAVEFRAVEYDWNRAAATAEANGRLDWAVALRSGHC